MRPGASALWPGQASDPAAWIRPWQRTASKLGMRPVTLRRISQHPPVTSKLGLSSRLALPAHFHRQPGFLMCGLLNEALTRHVVKAQLSRHTHTHSHMHTGKRQQTRHAHTTASRRHCCKPSLFCACSLCPLHSFLARQQAASLSSFLLSHPFPSLSTLGSYLIHPNPPFPLCPLLLCSMCSIY